MEEPRSGKVTFLFTYVEGSTELLQRIGDAPYAKLLADARRLGFIALTSIIEWRLPLPA